MVSLTCSWSHVSLLASSRLDPHGGRFSSWSRNHWANVLLRSWPVGGSGGWGREREGSFLTLYRRSSWLPLPGPDLTPTPDPATASPAKPHADWLSPEFLTTTTGEDEVISCLGSIRAHPYTGIRCSVFILLYGGRWSGENWALGARHTGSRPSGLTVGGVSPSSDTGAGGGSPLGCRGMMGDSA